MKCYELTSDFTSDDLETISWSETEEKRVPRPGGYWTPFEARFTPDGRMLPDDFKKMNALWMRCAGQKHKPLQVLGAFSFLQAKNAAFWEDLAVATKERDPDGIELIHHSKIWSNIDEAPVEKPKFYLINILRRIDSWDEAETELVGTRPVDGYYTGFATKGPRVLKGSAIRDAWLWRDAKTLNVMCTQTFKDIAEELGCRGLYFLSVDVSER